MSKKFLNLMLLSALLLLYSCVGAELQKTVNQSVRFINDLRRRRGEKNFLFYRSNNINERACECPTMQSCKCCEVVTLLLIKTQKKLCANMMYQRNGLNVDISLDSDVVKTLTITNYRPVNICTQVPGSLFSRVCLNLVELNAFPRSLTVCPRFTITSKHQEWRINYTCVSISTELPAADETTPAPGDAEAVGAVAGGPMSGMITNGAMTMPPVAMTQPPPAGMAGPPPAGMPGTPPGGMAGPPPGNAVGIEPARSALYISTDRTKHFPSRLPPAYASYYANYSNTTSSG